MRRYAFLFQFALFLLFPGAVGCRKSTEAGPKEWPGTAMPCDDDSDCVKVPTFSGGCGQAYGYVESIHRLEVEAYSKMYREYQERLRSNVHITSLSSDESCGWEVMSRCRSRLCTLVDEKGEIPKEKLKNIRRNQYIPSEYRKYTHVTLHECTQDNDCVKVRSDRCRERYDAVNRRYEKVFRELQYKDILPIDCPRIAPDPTAAPEVVPQCSQGQCRLSGSAF